MDIVAFYLDPFGPLLEAMVRAEGGEQAMVRAVQCSMPDVCTVDEALSRAAKTIRNRVVAFTEFRPDESIFGTVRMDGKDPWTGEDNPRRLCVTDAFIEFLGARWAPIGVMNDPTNLNAHWVGNVAAIYHRLLTENWVDSGTVPA